MKKLIGALLAFVMMLTLAGCGSSSASESKWARRGQFADENLNYLTITDVTEMDLGEKYSGYHAAGMLDGVPYSGFTEFDGKALKGELAEGNGTESIEVTITEEGDKGLQLATGEGTVYSFLPME